MIAAILPLIPSILGFITNLFQRRKRRATVPDVGDNIDAQITRVFDLGSGYAMALLQGDRIADAYNRATGNNRPTHWFIAYPRSSTLAAALESDSALLYSWQRRAWVSTADKTIAVRV